LAALLALAFFVASLPAPALAQDVPPPTAEPPADDASVAPVAPAPSPQDRIRQLRLSRPARTAPAAMPTATDEPAPMPAFDALDAAAGADSEAVYQLNFKDSPLDLLLDRYSELTGRTMIKAPGINAQFTFKAQSKLTRAEMIQAMDSLLTMNNITLIPLGSRFYRVVQVDRASTEPLTIRKGAPELEHLESDALISQLVPLKYLEMEDAVNIVQAMLHGYGKVQRFDRINSLLVTETSANLKRIYDILDLVDQPTETRIETRVYEISHAKASDIAARLNELVSDSQGDKKEEVAQVAQPAVPPYVRRPPSMIRARQPAIPETPPVDTAAALEAAMAERGIVQGKVKILSDERTNIIIVISRPSNFVFFDKIVAVLDRPVDPEVIVKVCALEYADAEEMAGLLNDFIGAAKSEADAGGAPKTDGGADTTESRARALEEYVRSRAAAADRVRQAAGESAMSKIGQLSPNTKILADKRTNTLLLMGTKGDIAALQDVIKKVDIMLAQVLIEAVILEVNLNKNTAYGVGWLQKSMTAYTQRTAGPGGGVSIREPMASWGGNFGPNTFANTAGDTITRAFGGGAGLNYFFTFANLNIDAVLQMVASSSEGRVLATPVILTTDNTEASIISGQQIPIRTGDYESSGGTIRSDYEYKDVGIQLKVKPRINPSRYVTLDITQSADTLGESVEVGNSGRMTSINKREMTASISVPSRSTIVLGGLVQTDFQNAKTHVPILGSIPILGALFRSEDTTRHRTELLVLITPYVLISPEEARAETTRLHRSSNVAAEDWYRGWSDSSLAPFSPTKLREMKAAERRQAQIKTKESGAIPPPVALISPSSTPREPTPDAKDPVAFAREVEQAMSSQAAEADAATGVAKELAPAPALPEPESPASAAPFSFDPAVQATPEQMPPAAAEQPAAKPPRKSKKKRAEEPRPSMFPAPETLVEPNGEIP
jgi:general secretion pathway protein D